jgi:hypothetical protein
MIVNGDFEKGNTGFESDYAYKEYGKQPCGGPGSFTVGEDASEGHPQWDAFSFDAKSKFLMANGSNNADDDLWRQKVRVKTGTTYRFTVHARNVDPRKKAIAPVLQMVVDGKIIHQRMIPREALGTADRLGWYKVAPEFTATEDEVILALRSAPEVAMESPEAIGNNIGIEDITLTEVS